MEIKEIPGQEPVALEQTITPLERYDGEIFSIRLPFRFNIDEEIIEGKVQVRASSNETWADQAPVIRPFALTTEEYEGYQITAQDLDLEERRRKIDAYKQQHPTYSDVELAEHEEGNNQLLTLRFIDNAQRGFTPEERELLKRVHVTIEFGELAKIRNWEGHMYFPSEINGRYANFGNMELGKIEVFYPHDTGPLASDYPLTRSDSDDEQIKRVGPGHQLLIPTHPELVQPTQMTFIVI